MRVVYIDSKNMNNLEIKEIEDDLDTFYKLIDCRAIDIVRRKIGNKHFLIICDDEGLLKPAPIITAINKAKMEVMLVGSLIIVNNGGDGEVDGLTDSDIDIIKGSVVRYQKALPLLDIDF